MLFRKLLVAVMLATLLVPPALTPQIAAAACGAANVPTDITTNTTLSGNLTITANTTIRNNATLTLDPGTTVTICNGATLNVGTPFGPATGGLQALGTAAQPITFQAEATDINWGGISVQDFHSAVTLQHVRLVRGGGSTVSISRGALTIGKGQAAAIVAEQVTIENSGSHGIVVTMPTSVAEAPTLRNLTITASAGAPLLLDAVATAGLGAGNSFTSNTIQAILVRAAGASSINRNTTWLNHGIPYRLLGSLGVRGASQPTLTIAPGTTVELPPGDEFVIGSTFDDPGGLQAIGTAAQPIVFTSSDLPNRWRALILAAQLLPTTLRYVQFEHAGAGGGAIDATIRIEHDTSAGPTLDHVTIRNSGANGIWIDTDENNRDAPAISNLTIEKSSRAPLVGTAAGFAALGTGNTFAENGIQALQIRGAGTGGVRYNQTWKRQPIPYELLGSLTVYGAGKGAVLTIEAGNTILMNDELIIGSSSTQKGGLLAVGTADAQITFNASPSVANWDGLLFTEQARSDSQIAYTNFLQGGNLFATIRISGMSLRMTHVNISNSLNDGIRVENDALLTLEDSTLVNNTNGITFLSEGQGVLRRNNVGGNRQRGVNNSSTACVDAAGNFWGSANGPNDANNAADSCKSTLSNPSDGNVVSQGVLYTPWLTSATIDGTQFDTSTIQPDRSYAIDTGSEEVNLTVTVRDALGRPLAGKQVTLQTTLGTLTQPTAPTNQNGQTTARLRSTQSGATRITAVNTTDNRPLSGIAGVTFWPGSNTGGLIALSGAPYETPELQVLGKPFQQGFPISFRLPMQNRNSTAREVTVVYGVTLRNIGARFTPVVTLTRTLQPNESWNAPAEWVPTVTGHRCVLVTVTSRSVSTSLQQSSSFSRQQNLDIGPAGKGGFPGDPADRLGDALPGASDLTLDENEARRTFAQTHANLARLLHDATRTLDRGLSADPPVHSFNQIATVTPLTPTPITAQGDLTAAQAAALNSASQAVAELRAINPAVQLTMDRLGGAMEAGNLSAAANQRATLGSLALRAAQAYDQYATALDALVAASNPALFDIRFDPEALRARRARLISTGFNAAEVANLQRFSLSAAEIEALRQQTIERLSGATTGGTLFANMRANAAVARDFARFLRSQYTTTRLNQAEAPATLNGLALELPFVVGNPKASTATVDLRVVPINLPVNWTYTIEPASVELNPGETMTATLIMHPNGPVIEQTEIRLAIEGYIGSEQIGGIDVRRIAPRALSAPVWPVYLPLTRR
jgi:parallel beta-helix repeat protein